MTVCNKNRVLGYETRDDCDAGRIGYAFEYVMNTSFIGALRYNFAWFTECSCET
jgi:hypothetical protein